MLKLIIKKFTVTFFSSRHEVKGEAHNVEVGLLFILYLKSSE